MLAMLVAVLCLQGADAPDPRREIEEENLRSLVKVRRVFVDRLTGGETASQLRDMLIASIQGSKLFVLTENQDKADAVLRGSAEDLVFTDTFQSSESIDARASTSSGYNSKRTGSTTNTERVPGVNFSVGQNESARIAERKHEAMATVRLVNKDGDVIWSTTQESLGAKFRGASADVADKIAKRLTEDYERGRKLPAAK